MVLIVACGSSDESTPNNTVTVWQDDSTAGSYLIISTTSFRFATLDATDPDNECYSIFQNHDIVSVSNNTYVLKEIDSGVETNVTVVENGDTLSVTVNSTNTTHTFHKVADNASASFSICVTSVNNPSPVTDNTNTSPNPIIVSMTMAQLPSVISVNNPDTSLGGVEYRWSVSFDVDNSMSVNAGDLRFSLSWYVEDGAQPADMPLTDLNANLWELNDQGGSVSLTPISINVIGNTIEFVVNRDSHSSLGKIVQGTQVYFDTYYFLPGTGSHYDYYPADSSYTSMMDLGLITDPLNDTVDISGGYYPFIDLVSMSVVIN